MFPSQLSTNSKRIFEFLHSLSSCSDVRTNIRASACMVSETKALIISVGAAEVNVTHFLRFDKTYEYL